MQALLYKEQLVLHGCLAKAVDGGDHWAWKRHWVWLLQDRLCYAPITSANKSIHYIPLDRITVRPLPRGYKPCIGVQHIDDSMLPLPESRAGKTMSGQPQGRAFSVQYGARTVYWAASTSQDAKAWMQAIRDAWVDAVLYPDRRTSCCKAFLQIGTNCWSTASDTPSNDREDPEKPVSTAGHEAEDREILCDVEVYTNEAKGWGLHARPWIALHGTVQGVTSGRHLLAPLNGSAAPFSSAAVATCQIWVSAGMMHEISSVEVGLHGECKLWAPEKILLRPDGHTKWTEFPCNSILGNC